MERNSTPHKHTVTLSLHGICWMTPLKLWLHTAWNCNNSFGNKCMPVLWSLNRSNYFVAFLISKIFCHLCFRPECRFSCLIHEPIIGMSSMLSVESYVTKASGLQCEGLMQQPMALAPPMQSILHLMNISRDCWVAQSTAITWHMASFFYFLPLYRVCCSHFVISCILILLQCLSLIRSKMFLW